MMARSTAILAIITLLLVFTSPTLARSGPTGSHGSIVHHRGNDHAVHGLHRGSWHKKKSWTRHGHGPRHYEAAPKPPLAQVLKLPM
ncbi:hypothetical protein SAY86_003575 [Trapa natans]|uniref:Secreted protein n=1 Tax=Trapa natans TaxID=22666 RepID=A0AAN7M6D8_TRANT|nr:hypothetical protein SAY86_003575 [Trapa natans]